MTPISVETDLDMVEKMSSNARTNSMIAKKHDILISEEDS